MGKEGLGIQKMKYVFQTFSINYFFHFNNRYKTNCCCCGMFCKVWCGVLVASTKSIIRELPTSLEQLGEGRELYHSYMDGELGCLFFCPQRRIIVVLSTLMNMLGWLVHTDDMIMWQPKSYPDFFCKLVGCGANTRIKTYVGFKICWLSSYSYWALLKLCWFWRYMYRSELLPDNKTKPFPCCWRLQMFQEFLLRQALGCAYFLSFFSLFWLGKKKRKKKDKTRFIGDKIAFCLFNCNKHLKKI